MNSYAARRLALNATRRLTARSFHTTPRAFVKVGDAIPDLNVLVEGSPGNKINMADELSIGKSLIIGVPAAFST
jgi:2-Cys peroxiredoxin 5